MAKPSRANREATWTPIPGPQPKMMSAPRRSVVIARSVVELPKLTQAFSFEFSIALSVDGLAKGAHDREVAR